MKTSTKAIAAIMLMTVAVLFTGCVKEHPTPTNDDVVNINPEYVSIDWTTTTVTAYDDSTGDYTIQFTDTVPVIHPGSVIAIDRDTVVLYRFVLTATTQGNTVSLTTAEAYLTDIFYDSEFTLSTETGSKTNVKGLVFHPVEAYVSDGNGGYEALSLNGYRKGETRLTDHLWNFEYNNDGYELCSGDNWALYMERMNLDFGLDLDLFMNFGGRDRVEASIDALDRYMSRAIKVSAALVGRFNMEQMVRFDVEGSFRHRSDSVLWKRNILHPVNVKFAPGGVPVVVTLRSDLFRQAEVSGSGEITAYTGVSDHAEGRLGFEWQQTGEIRPVPTFENNFTFTPPTVEGKGQIQGKVWVFPRVYLMLYGIVGPSFDFKPYLADTLRGGFREQLMGQSNDYCAWSLDKHAGLDACCALSLKILGYEGHYPTPTVNIIDKKLYHSPKKIVHASGRPQGGQTSTVRFDVYDTNYLFQQSVMTPLPQIVKFEASGDLSSEYGIANSGTVQVNWTPNGNDTLWAKLYDQDGNVLSFDTIIVRCDSNVIDTCDWVDLGLPSGLLWATRNVGASSPIDNGNHYAWGETTTKSVYDWSTYRYCVYNEGNRNYGYNSLTKYCYNPNYGYNGFYDFLTILQSGDDAATAHYGGHTPRYLEWVELLDYTTTQWVTINGVKGCYFTGRNGNRIFLPANDDIIELGIPTVHGIYMSSSLFTGGGSYSADFLNLYHSYSDIYNNDSIVSVSHTSRAVGFYVRAVRSAK